jgi:peroxiredoxin Q/BCP
MKAYRDRYAEITAKGAQVVGISTDDLETLKKFKESLGAPFPFLSDPGGKVADQYGGTDSGYAKRATFVVGQDGVIGHVDESMAAVIPDAAIEACPSGATKKTTI